MEVELNVDGELSTHIVTADDIANGYIATTITTTGSGVINIEATATNNDGVTDTSSLVITIAPQDLITEIEVVGDVDGNGFITADELDIDGNFTVHVGLGDGAYEGLVVSVNGSDYVVTQADLDNGYIVATIAGVDSLVNITAEASDVWGDTDSANISITVDTVAPDAPVIDPVNGTDPITGTAEPGTTVTVTFPDGSTAEAVVDEDGNWSVPNPGLEDGDEVTAVATDEAGNSSDPTTAIVDGTAPVVTLDEVVTNDNTPALTGTVDDPEATVVVTIDGEDYEAVNNGDGTWTLADDVVAELADGDHEVTVTATDPAGNVGNTTGTITIDTVAPDAPVIDPVNGTDPITGTAEPGTTVTVTFPDGSTAEAVVDEDGNWSVPNPGLEDGDEVTAVATDEAGNSSDPTTAIVDGTAPVVTLDEVVTNDNTPALTGTVDDPEATVVVTIDGEDYEAVNNGDGTWTLADDVVAELADGDHEVTVTATDPAGNVGSTTGTITIDTVAPDAPVIDPVNGTDPITGTAEPGTTVTVTFPDGSTAEAVVDEDGNWSVPNPGLEDGDEVTAVATDEAGNSSDPTTAIVDGTAPVVTLDEVVTNDNTPALTGTVDDPEATVVVTIDGEDYEAVNNGDGTWTLADDVVAELADGDHEVTVTATDPAGNVGSTTGTITIDTVAPDAPVIDPVNGTDPITGTAEPGTTVTVTFPDGSTAEAVVDEDGNWSVPNPGLEDGDEVTAVATDEAGNSSDPTTAIVDGTAPVVTLDEVVTNDNTPALTGTVDDPEATVVVTIDGEDYEAVNNGDGTWTLADDVVAELADGDHEVTVTATDPAGNVGSTTGTITIDTVAPDAPVIDPVNGTDPITGTAEPGTTVTVTFPDGSTAEAVVDEDGNWSVPNPGLEDGDEVTAVATDEAGNSSDPTTAIVDGTAPVVTLDEVVTNDNTPALTGTVDDPEATVVVTIDGEDYEAVNNGDGTWTLADDVVAELADGDHEVTVTATDPAGNVGSTTGTITIDTVAPDAPVIDPVNGTDPITGTAEPGTTVTVTFPDGSTAEAVVDEDGNWSVPNPGLEDGDEVTAVATDEAGNSSDPTTAIVDGTAPVVTLDEVVTNDNTPALTGTVDDPEATVVVTIDGEDYEAVNNGDGTWTLADDVVAELADGDHEVTVTATDPAGNVGSTTGTITIDTVAPDAPVIDPVNGTDPITGTAEPGTTVTVTFPDGSTAEAVVDEDGNWSVPNPGLEDGDEVTAVATDEAGNSSDPTTAIVDGTAPVVTLDEVVTNDNTPALTGTVDDPEATVVVTIDGEDYEAVNNGDGTWTLADDVVAELADGDHEVTVTATDPAGNVGSTTGTITIDTVAPDAPVIDPVNGTDPITGTAEPGTTVTVTFPDGSTAEAVVDEDGNWSVPNPGLEDGDEVTAVATDEAGNSSDPTTAIVDGTAPVVTLDEVVTNDNTPALTGTVDDPEATVVVTIDGEDYEAVNNGDGTWTLADDVVAELADGDHEVTVTATDPAGNVGSTTGTITIDTVAPDAPVIDPVNGTDPITGTAEPGTTVTVTFPDGSTAEAVVDEDGNWSVPNPGLEDGDEVTAVATDEAGNSSDPTTAIVDGTAPVVTLDEVVTNDNTPALTGTVDDPEATVVVTIDGEDYEAVNNGDGTWTLADDVVAELADGDHEVTVTATDPAGNVGSTTGTITIDTVAPDAPVIDPVNGTDPITGTAEPGTTVTVTFPDGSTAEAVVDEDGNWSVPNPGLEDGDEVTAVATDEAGNSSDPTTAIVDGTAPVVTLDEVVTNDNTPALTGTVDDPEATVVVTIDGEDYEAVNNGDGTWTLADDVVAELADGDHEVTVTATDPAGNVGSTTGTITIDTVAPDAPVIDPVNGTDPITGTAEPGTTVTVTFPDGSTAEAVVDEDGNWSVPNPGLEDGDEVTAVATDEAGNSSDPTTAIVDGTAPVVTLDEVVTSDNTPALTGTVDDPEATVVVTIDGEDYEAVNNGDGTWTLADDVVAELADGDHEVTVTATDPAGNVGSTTGTITIDTVAPDAPVIDPVNGTDPITGTAEPGTTVTVTFPDGSTAEAVVDEDGNWSVPNPGLEDGDEVTAVATDEAGNSSDPTTAIVDGTAPVVTLDEVVTNDNTPALTGTVDDPEATVVVTIDGEDYEAVNNGDGTWTLADDVVAELADGDHEVTVTATDPAGNVGSTTGTITIDTVAPDAPVIDPVNGTDPITGTAEPGTTVTVTFPDGSTAEAVVDEDGNWSVPNPGLEDGDEVTAVATDEAGNSSDPTTAIVDGTAPVVTLDEVVTNDNTPALTGTVDDPEATVVVTIDGEDYEAVNNGDGTWTLADDVVAELADGDHEVTVTATDPAGNVGSTTGTITIDTVAPDAPVIDPVNGTDPITGTAEPGTTVTVTFPDGSTAEAVVDEDGNWSVPNPGLEDGDEVTAVATDEAGNSSDPTTAIVDGTAPVVTLDEVVTNDNTPALTGTVDDPEATVVVTIDGEDYEAVNNGDGTWTLADDVVAELADGDHEVTVTATDPAGNVGSTTGTITIDTVAPDAPVIDPVNGTDPITGTAEPGTTVTVTFPDGSTAEAVVDEDGNWSVPNPGLEDGDEVTAVATDEAGNSSDPTTAIVDGTAPVVTLDEVVTNDNTPALTGTVDDPEATVVVTIDGEDYEAVNNGDGTWTLADDVVAELADGDHEVTVTATDPAGNVGSTTGTITIDTVAPDAPVIDPVNGTDPITGTAEPGTTVTVTFPDGSTAEAVVDEDGNWSVPNPGLEDGDEVTAVATDEAGNSSDPTTAIVDGTAPVVTLDEVVTNDNTPALTGTVDDPEATVVVTIDGEDYEAVNNGDGTWTLADDVVAELADGDHEVTVTATDPAGNVGSTTGTITIDTVAPDAPVIDPVNGTDPITGTAEPGTTVTVTFPDGSTAEAVVDEDGNWSVPNPGLEDGDEVTAVATDEAGNSSDPTTAIVDGTAPVVTLDEVVTNDNTPALTGTVDDPEATVVVTIDGEDYEAVNNGDGTWTLADDVVAELADGDHEVTVTATDPAGNVGSTTGTITIDTVAPDAPVIDPVNGTDPITGTAEPGTTVTVTFPDGSTAEAVVDEDGNWSVPNPGLEDGDEVTAVATDEAGNSSDPTTAIVDGTAPVVTLDEVVTNDNTPALTGTVDDPEATVVVTIDGEDYEAVNNGDGTWTLADDVVAELADGDHEVTVTATDPAGNVGSTTGTITIDTVAPDAPVIDPVNGTDPITGTAEPGTTVTVTFPDGSTAEAVVDEDGNWSVPNPGLEDGDEVTAVATDEAGNSSDPTTAIVDGTAPVVTLDEVVTNDNTPALTGTVDDPEATVVVTIDGEDYEAVNNGDGTWTLADDVVAELADGDHEVTVTATDPAGNVGSTTGTITIDTVAPDAPVIDPVNGTDPITGTAEPGTTVTVTFPDGSTAEAVVDEDGNWSVPNPGLEDGDEVTAVATDEAGNSSDPTTAIVDGTAPVVTLDEVVTNDNTPALTGTVDDPEATVVVTIDGEDYEAVNNGDGTWTLADDVVAELADGDHEVTVTATDPAGNVGSTTGTITIDTVAPDAPVIDPVNGTDPITGTAEPGTTVTVTFPDGSTAEAVVDEDGNWSVPNPGLEDGDEVTAVATDEAGNSSDPTTAIVDGTAPVVTLDEVVTNDNTPALTGTVDDPEATVVVTIDGEDYEAVNNGDGTWTLADDVVAELADGDHEVTVTATDPAGNVGSTTGTITIDTVAPDAPVIDPVNGTDPITGTAEPGTTVTVTFPDGSTAEAVVDEDGNWSVPNPGLEDGDEVTAVATDEAGNSSDPTTAIVDGTAPVVTLDEVVTNDNTPALTGTVDDPEATVVVTIDGEDYEAVNNGDGTWTLADDVVAELADGDHEVTVTATDPAGNVGSTTGTITIDTVAPDAPVIDPVNGTDPITGTAEPGTTVTVTFPDGSTAEAVVDEDGNWSVPNPGLEDGDEVTAVATDEAGNSSDPTTAIVDGTAPVVTLDEVVTNDNTPALTGTVDDPEATVVVTIDGEDYEAVNNGDGTWTLADDVVAELADGDHEVTVTATDPAGNVGSTTGTITIDTVAPDAPVIDPVNGTDPITGTAEPGTTVTVTFPDGSTAEAVVDEDGNWSVPNPGLEDGDEVTAVATDEAGNSSDPTTAIVDTTPPLIAFDNVDDAFVNALPLQVGDDVSVGSHTYLLLASLAGLDLQLGSAGIGFNIDEGHTGDMTFNYSALISADALADYVLVLQKFDEETGQWTAVTGPGQADLLSLSLFGGTTVTVDGLEAGQYRAFMAFDGLLGVGLLGTLSGTADLYDQSQIGGYEVIAAEGNVITDAGIDGDVDVITDTTVVSMVNGVAVVDGGTTIDGLYGTLVINPDGSYTYTPFSGDAGLGQVDPFVYTLLDPVTGQTASATLYLHIDSDDVDMTWNPADPSQPATVDIVATDDLNVAEINPQALLVGDDIPSGSHTYLLLASLAGLDLQLGSAGIGFNIDEGHTGDMTFNYSALISADALADYVLVLQKFDEATGQWTAISGPGQADLLSLSLFGGTTITVDGLEAGQYRAFMAFDGLLGVGLVGTLSATMDLYDLSQVGGYEVVAASGNVITDAGIDGSADTATVFTTVSSVNGEAVVAGGTTIEGTYGTLVIHPNGSYTYTPYSNVTGLGQVDQFTYTLSDPIGGPNAATATLYFHLDSSVVDMTWNPADPSEPATFTFVATDDVDTSSLVMVNEVDEDYFNASASLLGILATTQTYTSGTFTLGSNMDAYGLITVNSLATAGTVNLNLNLQMNVGGVWTTVANDSYSGIISLLGTLASLDLSTLDLAAGTYRIQTTLQQPLLGGLAALVGINTDVNVTYLDQYVVSNTIEAEGNIFGNDATGSTFTQLQVTDANGNVIDVSYGTIIQGLHGNLVISANGDYSYTPSSTTGGGSESFTYTVTHLNGDTITATLNINVGYTIQGSTGNDIITDSAGDDLIYAGAGNDTINTANGGSDTLIFDLLNAANGTGGNGHDTWFNFHVGDTAIDSEADKIDISDLLVGYAGDGSAASLSAYVSVDFDGTDTIISIDRDGGAGVHSSTELLTLKNVDTSLEELLQNNQLLF
ncbi:type I secretion C-terminal target domain-containing protein [Acinetobacter haemolyticus]|nr:type I secretion C-terminal target domain-containing protein [Acinetobacter haemolyticus]